MYRSTVNIGPFSATETSVLGEILTYYLIFFRSRPIMNVTTSANIFEYKFINHFTAEHLLFLLYSTLVFVFVTNLRFPALFSKSIKFYLNNYLYWLQIVFHNCLFVIVFIE